MYSSAICEIKALDVLILVESSIFSCFDVIHNMARTAKPCKTVDAKENTVSPPNQY